jgi:hypothetical protein
MGIPWYTQFSQTYISWLNLIKSHICQWMLQWEVCMVSKVLGNPADTDLNWLPKVRFESVTRIITYQSWGTL